MEAHDAQRPEHDQGLGRAIEAAIAWLDERQSEQGYWVGMLESNACMEAEWLLAFHFLGYGVGMRTDLKVLELKERCRQGAELSRGFMINYNLYRHYFPLMALGRARRYLST